MGYKPIPVDGAIKAYARLKNWRLVAKAMSRPDGTKYQWHSITSAVYRARRRKALNFWKT